MQRWIIYATVSIVVCLLLVGGGVYGYRELLRPNPSPTYIPLSLRADISPEDQAFLADQIREQLKNEILLRQIVIDADLQAGFKVANEDLAVQDLKRRVFVKVSHIDLPNGRVPAIDIGVNGHEKEKDALDKAATRMIQDVWKMVGIDADTGKPMQGGRIAEGGGY
jgi:hypothetical protein